MNKITGAEYSIGRIFSKDFDFVIPPYQRPYAWTTEECGELFDDLRDFMVKQPDGEAYFLGSIVLVKKENEAESEVIDGQQRLTSLTMLLASISSALDGLAAQTFANYVNEPGNLVENIPPKPRLTIRKLDRDFFRKYIQELNLSEMLSLQALPDSQKRMRDNTKLFMERLANVLSGDRNQILQFGKFIINRCYMVAVSTPSQASAFRIFTILNDRGLDLTTSDILKADILGKLSKGFQDKYTTVWESTEEELGRDNFNDLLRHIRMIYMKSKPQKTILEEIREGVLVHFPDTALFIDDVLLPYADAFKIVLNAAYSSEQDNTLINDRLKWLLKIDNFDWIPPMIAYLAKNKNKPKKVEQFVVDLERLASSMFIRRKDINYRIDRYSKILTWIENNQDLSSADSPILLNREEDRDTIKALNGDVYTMMQRPRSYILTKLDSILADKLAIYEPSLITIEHILPQTVEPGSEWDTVWPNPELRDFWLHKIANLALLTRPKNSAAQNWDFKRKKRDYFSDKLGVSSSALTTTVLRESEWTPEIVKERQQVLVDKLKAYWKLNSDYLCDEATLLIETTETDSEEKRQQNPDYSEDELILALDTYFGLDFANNYTHINPSHPAITELSELMIKMSGLIPGISVGRSFRNPNGIYSKLTNFLYLDTGKGRPNYGALDKVIWKRYSQDRNALLLKSESLRSAIMSGSFKSTYQPFIPEGDANWNGEYYANFGQGMGRDWDDAVKYGFISAGGGAWYSNSLNLLKVGKRVWVNVPGYGYAGVGIIESEPIKADRFEIVWEGRKTPFYSAALNANYHREFENEPDKAEYIVKIKWQKTLPLSHAINEPGLYGNQHTVCMSQTPKWEHTTQRLKALFRLE